MKPRDLQPGCCYKLKEPNGNILIFEVSTNPSQPPVGFNSKYIFAKRAISKSKGSNMIRMAFNKYHIFHPECDSFEPLDMAVLDILFKLYETFAAAAIPLIEQ